MTVDLLLAASVLLIPLASMGSRRFFFATLAFVLLFGALLVASDDGQLPLATVARLAGLVAIASLLLVAGRRWLRDAPT